MFFSPCSFCTVSPCPVAVLTCTSSWRSSSSTVLLQLLVGRGTFLVAVAPTVCPGHHPALPLCGVGSAAAENVLMPSVAHQHHQRGASGRAVPPFGQLPTRSLQAGVQAITRSLCPAGCCPAFDARILGFYRSTLPRFFYSGFGNVCDPRSPSSYLACACAFAPHSAVRYRHWSEFCDAGFGFKVYPKP